MVVVQLVPEYQTPFGALTSTTKSAQALGQQESLTGRRQKPLSTKCSSSEIYGGLSSSENQSHHTGWHPWTSQLVFRGAQCCGGQQILINQSARCAQSRLNLSLFPNYALGKTRCYSTWCLCSPEHSAEPLLCSRDRCALTSPSLSPSSVLWPI